MKLSSALILLSVILFILQKIGYISIPWLLVYLPAILAISFIIIGIIILFIIMFINTNMYFQ